MMKKIFTLIAFCMAVIVMQAQDSWTVAGSGTLLGSTWDVNDNSNNMAKNSDGLWELVKTDVSLEAGIGIDFKVVKNHSWDEVYPSSNYSFKVQETAAYKVTITFDENSKAINVATEKTGSAVIGEKTWTVAGDEALTGADWKPELTDNDMMDMGDGTYRLMLMGKTLDCTKEYKFKVCANHGWDKAYGSKNDDGTYGDYILTVDEDGVYDVTIVFNATTKDITVETEKTAGAVIEKEWTVVGDQALTGLDWDIESTACNMQKQDDGSYKLVLADRALQKDTEYKFKVVANHTWKQQYGTTYDDGTIGDYVMLVPEDGTYTVTITFDPATKEVVALANSTTGIATVIRDSFTVNQIFDLNGCRVAQPKHGLYIINGKKVVIK